MQYTVMDFKNEFFKKSDRDKKCYFCQKTLGVEDLRKLKTRIDSKVEKMHTHIKQNAIEIKQK